MSQFEQNPYEAPVPPTYTAPKAMMTTSVIRRPPRVWPVFVALVLALVLLTVLQILLGAGLAILEMSKGVPPEELMEQLPTMLTTPGMFMLITSCAQVSFVLI